MFGWRLLAWRGCFVFLGDVYVFEEPVGFLCVVYLGFGLDILREVNLRV